MRSSIGKGAISGGQTLSPEVERRPRKISAPPRIGAAGMKSIQNNTDIIIN